MADVLHNITGLAFVAEKTCALIGAILPLLVIPTGQLWPYNTQLINPKSLVFT